MIFFMLLYLNLDKCELHYNFLFHCIEDYSSMAYGNCISINPYAAGG